MSARRVPLGETFSGGRDEGLRAPFEVLQQVIDAPSVELGVDVVEQYAARARVFEVKEGVAAEIGAPRGTASTLSKGSSGI